MMKKILQIIIIAVTVLLAEPFPAPVYGQDSNSGSYHFYTEKLNERYEERGEALIGEIRSGLPGNNGEIRSSVSFASMEEAKLFCSYFYRYVYLGKEAIVLKVENIPGNYTIYADSDDLYSAIREHDTVMGVLEAVVEESAGKADEEKARTFYDWVYEHVSYDWSLEKTSVYEAVLNGQSVCWGFTATYLKLCRLAGLSSEAVIEGNHAWNRVMIDGQWRHCDITWNKCANEHCWFFLPEEDMRSDSLHMKEAFNKEGRTK